MNRPGCCFVNKGLAMEVALEPSGSYGARGKNKLFCLLARKCTASHSDDWTSAAP